MIRSAKSFFVTGVIFSVVLLTIAVVKTWAIMGPVLAALVIFGMTWFLVHVVFFRQLPAKMRR